MQHQPTATVIIPAVSDTQYVYWVDVAASEQWPASQSRTLASFGRLANDTCSELCTVFEQLLGLSTDPSTGPRWRTALADKPADHTATARGRFREACCTRNGLDGPSFVEFIFVAFHECLDFIVEPIIASLRQTSAGRAAIVVTSTGETIAA
jgi:hypothetical protein